MLEPSLWGVNILRKSRFCTTITVAHYKSVQILYFRTILMVMKLKGKLKSGLKAFDIPDMLFPHQFFFRDCSDTLSNKNVDSIDVDNQFYRNFMAVVLLSCHVVGTDCWIPEQFLTQCLNDRTILYELPAIKTTNLILSNKNPYNFPNIAITIVPVFSHMDIGAPDNSFNQILNLNQNDFKNLLYLAGNVNRVGMLIVTPHIEYLKIRYGTKWYDILVSFVESPQLVYCCLTITYKHIPYSVGKGFRQGRSIVVSSQVIGLLYNHKTAFEELKFFTERTNQIWMDLSHNQITRIEPGAFEGLPNLEKFLAFLINTLRPRDLKTLRLSRLVDTMSWGLIDPTSWRLIDLKTLRPEDL
ncbi:hypothetical protein KUTeg_005518 [Tegillarca granosa]|uniref:Uncharacterized protein n=1 Tax=Tegillarca granosa TaxID=220873 RepID=A0ABQ9FK24_TEGGR|nr:hypothetical protein KUTeg_005518 [Tegillarca granosa]